jgi:hypothetical protein
VRQREDDRTLGVSGHHDRACSVVGTSLGRLTGEEEGTQQPPSPTHSHIMAHLSVAAVTGAPAPKTLCLTGILQGHSISILVDSGSSHTFLSSKLGSSLSNI